MATGDVTLFEEFAAEIGSEVHNLGSDTLKVGLIDNSTAPTAADATPRWALYVGNEVSADGNYTANGETLSNVDWSEAGGVSTLDADNVSLAQDGSGFDNAYWAIVYNDTATNDEAICFVELGGPVSEQAGPVAINWNDSGIFTLTANP